MQFDSIGIDGFSSYVDSIGSSVNRAASMSINETLRMSHGLIKKDMMASVNLPSSYFGTINEGRLRIAKYSKPEHLYGSLNARKRSTSLYRFLIGSAKRGADLRVGVKAGSNSVIKGSFAIRLKNGNMGFALRVKGKVTSLRNSRKAKMLSPGLFLLYSVSISQMMKQTLKNNDKIYNATSNYLNNRFISNLDRLSNG